ncbi:Vacuolar protein-sorting-associated protein 33 [Polyrhizophydium stewartii]|uniref:Vacuolar protein-sorting-associated protein 33 n=1 Tax=Polyrhizophydium stewartii TaxID=2732419 RepID=A0ABR4MVD7_9FUNG
MPPALPLGAAAAAASGAVPAAAAASAAAAQAPFSPAALREVSRRELIHVIDSVRGRKTLVIDPSLASPLSLVAEFAVLKEHGVDRIFTLNGTPIDADVKSLVYITRPTPIHMKWLADQVKRSAQRSKQHGTPETDFSLFYVPRRTLMCDRILEEEGVFGDIAIGEYHLDIIPVEDDLLSLEIDAFKSLFVDGDTSAIHSVAHALLKFQLLFGFASRVLGKGEGAKILADLLARLRRENNLGDQQAAAAASLHTRESEFDSILILDRTVDLVSVMRTQLTYEGLIDELFGIKSTFVEITSPVSQTSAVAVAPAANSKPKKMVLNNNDRVFADVRNLGFEIVGSALSHAAMRIQEEEDVRCADAMPRADCNCSQFVENAQERHKLTTTSQLKDFAAKIGGLQQQRQSLSAHNLIYDEILKFASNPETAKRWNTEDAISTLAASSAELEYIDEMISRQAPFAAVMRLLCLYCQTNGGLKTKQYDSFRRSIVQTYGYQHILTLQHLRHASLFFPQESSAAKNAYPAIAKQLQLFVDYDSDQPNDASYVYHGFAPISVRLVQLACRGVNASEGPQQLPSWRGGEDVLRLLPGPHFEETVSSGDRSFRKKMQQAAPLTLVVFLGGCTMAEVAALRFLGDRENARRSFVILTTGIITGPRLIESLASRPTAGFKNAAN